MDNNLELIEKFEKNYYVREESFDGQKVIILIKKPFLERHQKTALYVSIMTLIISIVCLMINAFIRINS